MRKVGEIILILNDKFAVIKTSELLILGSEITVYSEIRIPELQNYSINNLIIPKGKLKVAILQESNVYLVTIIARNTMQETPENQNIAKSVSTYKSFFDNVTLDNTSNEPAPYSAKMDLVKSLNLEINTNVCVGDSIAF